LDITQHNVAPLVEAMGGMAFQARNLSRAAKIYEMMLQEKNCGIILCLAGSLISAGLKKIVYQMVRENMVDAIVSTGANIVDQDFFEGLGFKHYIGSPFVDDQELRALAIDRIYDTYIDENTPACSFACRNPSSTAQYPTVAIHNQFSSTLAARLPP